MGRLRRGKADGREFVRRPGREVDDRSLLCSEDRGATAVRDRVVVRFAEARRNLGVLVVLVPPEATEERRLCPYQPCASDSEICKLQNGGAGKAGNRLEVA